MNVFKEFDRMSRYWASIIDTEENLAQEQISGAKKCLHNAVTWDADRCADRIAEALNRRGIE